MLVNISLILFISTNKPVLLPRDFSNSSSLSLETSCDDTNVLQFWSPTGDYPTDCSQKEAFWIVFRRILWRLYSTMYV